MLPRAALRGKLVQTAKRETIIRDCAIIIRRGAGGAKNLELSSKNLDSTPLQNKKKLVLTPLCYVKNNVAPPSHHPPTHTHTQPPLTATITKMPLSKYLLYCYATVNVRLLVGCRRLEQIVPHINKAIGFGVIQIRVVFGST